MNRIYLDYNASTPLESEVRLAMEPFLQSGFGNPSSAHWAGRPGRAAVERARGQVAALLGCSPHEIVFTGGGTEANNHALKGTYFRCLREGSRERPAPHFITTAVEHPAILEPLRFLEGLGARVTILPVDRDGRVDPQQVGDAITPQTLLVSVMHANNEVGTIQPIAEISAVTRRAGVLLHTDAAQTVGKIPARIDELGVDLLSLAGHKLYGPKGVGALYLRSGVGLDPLLHGAGHESGRRAGTENVLLVVGLGQACEVATRNLGMPAVRPLRDHFEGELTRRLGDRVTVNGHPTQRLPNTLSVNFVGRIGAEVLDALDGVAASTGSACHAGSVELSPVLRAMGVSTEEGMGAVRFSLGRETTAEEIESVLSRLEALLG
jgi:cysteine desulfurase